MMKSLGSFFILFLFSTMLNAGTVASSVSTTEVLKGDSVLFTITIIGQESEPLPSMMELGGVVIDEITRSSESNFLQVDGKNIMEQTKTVTFSFKPMVDMVIPAFQVSVDGEVKITNAIALKVVDTLSIGTSRKNEHFILEMKLQKEKVYVGEPVLLSVYFKNRTVIDIMSLDYKQPKLDNFFSEQLGKEKKYKQDGFTVHEITYLLKAKKEGKVEVAPAHAKVARRVRKLQSGGYYSHVAEWHEVVSPTLSIEVVKPQVAHDLLGNFSLTEKIDTLEVRANQPVNLQVKIVGEGSLADFEGINFEIPNVTVYSDDAKEERQNIKGKVQSSYIKSFVFIADHAFTIPSKHVRVFNYKTGEVDVLQSKVYNIKMKGFPQEVETSSTVVHTKTPIKLEEKNLLTLTDVFEKKFFMSKLPSTLTLALVFLLGMLVMLFLQRLFKIIFTKKAKKQSFNGHEALQILYPKIGQSVEVEEMVRKLYAIKCGEKGIEIDRQLLGKLLNQYK